MLGPLTNNPLFHEVQARLDAAERVVIAVHADPDMDAIGSALAMRAYLMDQGKSVKVWLRGFTARHYDFLASIGAVVTSAEAPGADTLLVMDCATAYRVDGWQKTGVPSSYTTVINWDHHQHNDQFGDLNLVDTKMSSMGEFVYWFFTTIGYAIQPDQATQLYAAIVYDTGRFAYSNVTTHTFQAAAALVAAGASPESVNNAIYNTKSVAQIKTLGTAMDRLTIERRYGYVYTYLLPDEPMVSQDALELMRALKTAKVLVLFRAKESGVKLNFRSKTEFDVATFAQQFGGGGHRRASGAWVAGSLDTVMVDVRHALENALR